MNDDKTARLRVRLYVAGDAPNSVAAIANLRAAIAACSVGPVDIEIIDVVREPERGLNDGVFVTPMLIKLAPPPERRVLGSLHDQLTLLGALDIRQEQRE